MPSPFFATMAFCAFRAASFSGDSLSYCFLRLSNSSRCEEQLRHLQSRFEQNPPTELDDTKALLSEVNRFLETIGSYEQEMKRMAADCGSAPVRVCQPCGLPLDTAIT